MTGCLAGSGRRHGRLRPTAWPTQTGRLTGPHDRPSGWLPPTAWPIQAGRLTGRA